MIRYKNEVTSLLSLLESKDHLIDKLNLDDEKKRQLKAFFKKYPNYENKIDWNRKDLSWKDFEGLLANEGKSKSQAKKTGITGLTEGKDYEILFSNDICTIYYPLTHLGSKVLADKKTAPFTTGKWCISMNDAYWWQDYTFRDHDFFFVFFKPMEGQENKGLKFAISRYLESPWLEPEKIEFFGNPDYYLNYLTFFNEADQEIDPFSKEFPSITGASGKAAWTSLKEDLLPIIWKTRNKLCLETLTFIEKDGYKLIAGKVEQNPEIYQIIVTEQANGKTISIPTGYTRIGEAALQMPEQPIDIQINIPGSMLELKPWSLAGLTQDELVLSPKCMTIQAFAIADSNIKVVRYSDEPMVLHFTPCSFLKAGKDVKPGSPEAQDLFGQSFPASDPRLITLEWPGLLENFIMAIAQGEFLGPDDFDLYNNRFNLTRYGIGKVMVEGKVLQEFPGTFTFMEWLGMVGWSVTRMSAKSSSHRFTTDKQFKRFYPIYKDIYPMFFPED